MGKEALCHVKYGTRTVRGKAHLASEAIEFTGEGLRLAIPFKEVLSVEAKRGQLKVRSADQQAVFEIGAQAEAWALKIRYPKGRLDKLGIKPGSQVCLLGLQDEEFLTELEQRTQNVCNQVREGLDFILFRANSQEDLALLDSLQNYIRRDGAIWVIWPKGQRKVNRDHVFAASKAAGLVDIKICAFSEELSGLKVVIPRDRR